MSDLAVSLFKYSGARTRTGYLRAMSLSLKPYQFGCLGLLFLETQGFMIL